MMMREKMYIAIGERHWGIYAGITVQKALMQKCLFAVRGEPRV